MAYPHSLFIDPCKSTIEQVELNDLTGNTDWIRMELDDETAAKLTYGNLHDDHGAAYYKLVEGVVTERTLEERMADWLPEPEPEPDYQAACEQIFAILDGEAE